MDPFTQQVLVDMAVKGLGEVIGRSLGEIDSRSTTATAERAVAAAASELTEVEAIRPELGGEQLRQFLTSQEAQNVVRQIYADDGTVTAIEAIEEEFYVLWRLRVGDSSPTAREELSRLFTTLVRLCERSLDHAIEEGRIVALDTKAARRHGELRGSLESVQKVLDVLAAAPALDAESIDDYASNYARQVAKREGVIVPAAIDTARQFPIDDLYVPGDLLASNAPRHQSLDYEAFAKGLFRAVVLGNPGSGKSTLARKLTADLARGLLEGGGALEGAVPFFVELRKFGAHKKKHPCSIVDYLESASNFHHQVKAPVGAVEYLLLTNRAVVIFDGLDELLDTSYRAEISADVESFASLYPSVPILVTSREVGYQEAPLPPETFACFHLEPFTEDKVEEYARKWFAVSDRGADAAKEAESFMRESASAEDLRTNALLLGLMCSLYKGSGYIPENRTDVYEACAELLFNRWDRLRQIGKPLKIESLIRPTMQHLAAWIYSDEGLQGGVGERALIAETASYLQDRRFEDPDEAKLEATRFIEFCRGRPWVFTDIGTTGSGERLYQFTHRTFLEFFTAGHLVRMYPTPAELLDVLGPRISSREWDVVAKLAFHLLEQNRDGAANELLTRLTADPVAGGDEEQGNRLDFAAQSLEFLVPAPKVSRALTAQILEHFVALWTAVKAGGKNESALGGDRDLSLDAILSLLQANPENAQPIRDAFVDELSRWLAAEKAAPRVAELALSLRHHAEFREGADVLAEEITELLLTREGERLRELAGADPDIASDLVAAGGLSAERFLDEHGLEPFFRQRSLLFTDSDRVSVSEIVVSSLLWEHDESIEAGDALATLSMLGALLRSAPTPWFTAKLEFSGWMFARIPMSWRQRDLVTEDLSQEQRFALVALAAGYLEERLMARELAVRSAWAAGDSAPVSPPNSAAVWIDVFAVLYAKQDEDPERGREALAPFALPREQNDLLLEWISGELQLVSEPKSNA